MATPAQLRKVLLSLEGVEEGAHMDHPDFRVGGRIFATLTADEKTGMLELPPEVQASVLGDAVFRPAAGAWGRAGCTLFELAKVPIAVLRPLAEEAVRHASEKKKKAQKKR